MAAWLFSIGCQSVSVYKVLPCIQFQTNNLKGHAFHAEDQSPVGLSSKVSKAIVSHLLLTVCNLSEIHEEDRWLHGNLINQQCWPWTQLQVHCTGSCLCLGLPLSPWWRPCLNMSTGCALNRAEDPSGRHRSFLEFGKRFHQIHHLSHETMLSLCRFLFLSVLFWSNKNRFHSAGFVFACFLIEKRYS